MYSREAHESSVYANDQLILLTHGDHDIYVSQQQRSAVDHPPQIAIKR